MMIFRSYNSDEIYAKITELCSHIKQLESTIADQWEQIGELKSLVASKDAIIKSKDDVERRGTTRNDTEWYIRTTWNDVQK